MSMSMHGQFSHGNINAMKKSESIFLVLNYIGISIEYIFGYARTSIGIKWTM